MSAVLRVGHELAHRVALLRALDLFLCRLVWRWQRLHRGHAAHLTLVPSLALCAALFVLFLPFLTAMPVPEWLWGSRLFRGGPGLWTWFPSWI